MEDFKNIDLYFPIVVGIILFILFSIFIVVFAMMYRRSQLRYKAEKEQLRQELLRAEIEIKEVTLQQVSQEIHDNFGQVASLIKINMLLLSQDLDKENQAKVKESLDLIKQLITDMKSLSRSLKGENLQQIGWVKTIEKDLARINALQKARVTLHLEGSPEQVAHDVQLILYRIVQEILNNLIKHAQATEAQLTLAYKDRLLSLYYSDNGIGFDPHKASLSGGSGLENMALRAQQIGLRFSVQSATGQGTCIEITKPETT